MGNLYWNLTRAVGVLIFIVLIHPPQCESMSVTEGELAQLDFPYPCDSTEVTLQDGNALPFYSSVDPQNMSLSSNQNLVNDTESGLNQCFLNLTINPVSRTDQGTYILTAYKNGDTLPDDPRIYLGVDFLPGKAWCETISNDYNDREWVTLQCTAEVEPQTEPQTGQIVCYQNDLKLPLGNKLKESDGQLNQVILARLDGLVYCCFSILPEIDKCGCTDWRWDPINDSISDIIDIADPCPQLMSTEDPTSTHIVIIDNVNSPKNSYWMKVAIVLSTVISIFAIIVIAVCLCHCKDHELTRLQCCNTQRNDPPSSENDVRLSENEEMIEL